MGPFVAISLTYLFGLLLIVASGSFSVPALAVPTILIIAAYAGLNLFEHDAEPTDDELEHSPTVEDQMEEAERLRHEHEHDLAA